MVFLNKFLDRICKKWLKTQVSEYYILKLKDKVLDCESYC